MRLRFAAVIGLFASSVLITAPALAADHSHLPGELTGLGMKSYSPARGTEGRIDLPTNAKLVIPAKIPIVSGSTGSRVRMEREGLSTAIISIEK